MVWFLAVFMSGTITPLPAAYPAQPVVPGALKEVAVPPGYQFLFKVEAKGVQIYKTVKDNAGKLEWILEGPLADLLDDKGRKAGWHYDGPSWEAVDGSKVVRDKTVDVKSAPAPMPNDDIPWLLVKIKAEAGEDGIFSPAVYLQRLETVGGKAPAEQPKRAGTKVGVPYRAVYCFFGKVK
jgi:hypothetical protein